jgi:hypothetical protein
MSTLQNRGAGQRHHDPYLWAGVTSSGKAAIANLGRAGESGLRASRLGGH